MASTAEFKKPLSFLGTLALNVFSWLGIVRLVRVKDTRTIKSSTNLTLLNAILVVRGPMTEKQLTKECIWLQIMGSAVAFAIRYGLANVFYDGDRR